MKVSLLTDAPKHNLALMKLSAHHKACGDEVSLNLPLWPADKTYASILYEKNLSHFHADVCGGPAYVVARRNGSIRIRDEVCGPLLPECEAMAPDYGLYPGCDYSLGYTFRPCARGCAFCVVGSLRHPDVKHHSIWEFHDSRFKKICLLNNNTFMDPRWRETFEEIWDAKLTVVDENGYDLRLIDDEKAAALKKTRWDGKIHFAWDRMQDEAAIVRGLECLKKVNLRSNAHVYVLIGWDTTEAQDLHRCQVLKDLGFDPYIMPYGGTVEGRRFKRFVDSFMWRKYPTMAEAWRDYAA